MTCPVQISPVEQGARVAPALLLAVLVLCCSVPRLRGEVIVFDDFSYVNGLITAVSAGKWVAHSGTTDDAEIAAGALVLNQAKGQDINTPLPDPPYNEAKLPALYAKFTVRFSKLPSAAGSYFAHFKDGSATGFRARVWALIGGAADGAFRLGLSSGSSSAPAAVFEMDLGLDTTYSVVIRLALGDSVASLWVNPTAESDQSVTSDTGSAIGATSFAFRQSSGMGVTVVDDLVVATTFEEALTGATINEGPPLITLQPEAQTIPEGGAVSFQIKASGALPLAYQWQFNNVDIAGANEPLLSLPVVAGSHAGDYLVTVTNPEASVTSDAATLVVGPPIAPGARPPLLAFTNLLEHLVRSGDTLRSTNITEYALRPTELLTIRVAVRDPAGRPLRVRPIGEKLPSRIAWQIPEPAGPVVSATLVFAAAAEDAGHVFLAQLEAANADATNRWQWKIYVPTPVEQQMVINEFLALPTTNATASHYNPLRRATPRAPNRIGVEDEFVEIVNASDSVVDLQNWTLSDSAAVRHAFGPFDLLLSSNAVVVYGGKSSGSEPQLAPGVLVVPASRSSTGLALNNGGDRIILRNAQGQLVARVVYTRSLVKTNASATRVPDLSGAFASHASASSLRVSAGTRADGEMFGDPNASGLLPLKVAAGLGSGFSIEIRWNVETNRTYSVLRASSVTGPFERIKTGLTFDTRQGSHRDDDASTVSEQFYRVSSP